jgi:hypothetical protein
MYLPVKARFWLEGKEKKEKKRINSIRISNEGREIAAFEEETLALRRELQEARASRNLAENHAAKCVNFAVSRSVTPVTFDTPCITSTPVRTALAETRSLPPVLPSATSSHTFSVCSSSALRSRSAEVMALFVSEARTEDRNSGSASCEDSPRSTKDENDRSGTASALCQSEATDTMNDRAVNAAEIGSKREAENQRSELTAKNFWQLCMTELADCLTSSDQKRTCDTDTARRNNGEEERPSTIKEETQTNLLNAAEGGGAGDQQPPENPAEVETQLLAEQKIETETPVSSDTGVVVEERKDANEQSSDQTSKIDIERSVDHASWQRLYAFQRGSCKKSRRKKCELRRCLSETDKFSKSQHWGSKVSIGTSYSSSTGTSRGMVNESCPNGDHMNRAITEVPEVTVVGGGSIMPKDLCSTGPLTSRTKTAPSRATYTTTYI